MRRVSVLGVLIGIGALSMVVAAYQQPPAGGAGRGGQQAPRVVEVEKLKDNLFVLRGGGGNTAVFVQAKGVTVVDTKNPGWGQPILAKIKEITDKPVTTIINTHTHGDHVSGNVEFPATVDIIVHENTAANMKKMAPVTGFAAPATPAPSIFEQNQGRGLAKRTFKDKMTLGSGADQVDLYYFGRGHTNGDAWVLFPSLRVVHAGDIFASNTGLPILDANNGGSGVEIPDTLMKAHSALSKSADSIITGHSTVLTFNDLRQWAEWNRGFLEMARAGKKAGQTPEQVAQAWKAPANFPPPANEAAQKGVLTRLQANIQTIYNETK
jgi:glyoxylase-like metal-dependent hydrolase (beta-lactamase superfamily II)